MLTYLAIFLAGVVVGFFLSLGLDWGDDDL